MSTHTSPAAPPAGWYPCPADGAQLRFFDGRQWTNQTAPRPYGPPASAPVPYGHGGPAYGSPAAGTGMQPTDAVHWLVPTGRSGSAIAAGYLGLFALGIWPLGPVALGVGIGALRRTTAGPPRGAGRAWFAIVAGVLATVAMILLVVSGFFG